MYGTLRKNLGVQLSLMFFSMVHSWWPTMSVPGLLSLFSSVSLWSSLESQDEILLSLDLPEHLING